MPTCVGEDRETLRTLDLSEETILPLPLLTLFVAPRSNISMQKCMALTRMCSLTVRERERVSPGGGETAGGNSTGPPTTPAPCAETERETQPRRAGAHKPHAGGDSNGRTHTRARGPITSLASLGRSPSLRARTHCLILPWSCALGSPSAPPPELEQDGAEAAREAPGAREARRSRYQARGPQLQVSHDGQRCASPLQPPCGQVSQRIKLEAPAGSLHAPCLRRRLHLHP